MTLGALLHGGAGGGRPAWRVGQAGRRGLAHRGRRPTTGRSQGCAFEVIGRPGRGTRAFARAGCGYPPHDRAEWAEGCGQDAGCARVPAAGRGRGQGARRRGRGRAFPRGRGDRFGCGCGGPRSWDWTCWASRWRTVSALPMGSGGTIQDVAWIDAYAGSGHSRAGADGGRAGAAGGFRPRRW